MLRCSALLIVSLIASLAIADSAIFAQDLSPAKPPTGIEPAAPKPAEAAPPATPADAPRRPNAQPGDGGQRRRNADPNALAIPDDVQLVRDVVYATAPGKDGKSVELMMDCAFPKQSDGAPLPVVVFVHGGGWSSGTRATGLPFAIAFARGDYFGCTISYRLSGEATFPAQLHDVKAAIRFIRAHAEELAIDPDRIGVMGISAGGHLSALLGVTANAHDDSLEGELGDTKVSSAVKAVVDISGPHDLILAAPGGTGGSMISGLLGGPVSEKKDLAKAASPVNHVDGGDAPFLIIQGGQDQLVPDIQAEVMRDALKKAGVECEYLHIPEAGHGVQDRRAYMAMAAFFDKHLGGNATPAFEEIARRLAGQGAGAAGGAGRRRPNAQPE